jgi:hypothetical protein
MKAGQTAAGRAHLTAIEADAKAKGYIVRWRKCQGSHSFMQVIQRASNPSMISYRFAGDLLACLSAADRVGDRADVGLGVSAFLGA